MEKFENEVEFKKHLDKLGVRYGDLDNSFRFYVEFIDNKGASLVNYVICKTPIAALRAIPELLKKFNLPIEDLDVVVRFAFDTKTENNRFVSINSVISPYMYFKEEKQVLPEDKTSE